MLEKRAHPANKDGLSLITRSLLFCLLSALWHIRDLTSIALMIALIVMSIFRLQSTVK